MKEIKNQDELFTALKNSPEEISLKRMSTFIQGISVNGIQSNAYKSNGFFGLKNYIIMGIIASTLVAGYLILSSPSSMETTQTSNSNLKTVLTEQNSSQSNNNFMDEKRGDSVPLESKKTNSSHENNSPVIYKNKEIKSKTSPSNYSSYERGRYYSKNKMETPDTSSTKIPENLALRPLKRKLISQLSKDGLISHKNEWITLNLLKDKIILNGNEIPKNILANYLEITSKIGYGPNRRIEITNDYIKAGDFTDQGFIGHGLGTFIDHHVDLDSNETLFDSDDQGGLFDTKEEIESDYLFAEKELKMNEVIDKLNFHAKQVKSQKDFSNTKKKLGSVNIKEKTEDEFIQWLQEHVMNDGFIQNKSEYLLIEIPKDQVFINGNELEGEQKLKYYEFFDEYKIAYGPQRQIRMGDHVIMAGDFKPGSFSGTIINFE